MRSAIVGWLLTSLVGVAAARQCEDTAPVLRGSGAGAEGSGYYEKFFGRTVAECALENQSELVRAVELAQANTLPPGQAALLYGSVAAALPVVSVKWDGAHAFASKLPYLTVALRVQRCVLVEVENLTPLPQDMTASFRGLSASNTARILPGETRGLLARLLEQKAGTTGVVLTIASTTAQDDVLVPLTVLPAARLRGLLFEGSTPAPGRVWVRGGDAEFRHGPAFRETITLGLRPILAAPGHFYKLPFFYANEEFELDLPPGRVDIVFERGFEHPLVEVSVVLAPGETRTVELTSQRFVSMRDLGWISGDTHVHWVKDYALQNEALELLAVIQRAEDVQIVQNLTLRAAGIIKPDQYPMGPVRSYCTGEYQIHMGEEYRNDPFYGHLNFLNIVALVLPITTGDFMGPTAEDFPLNVTKIDEALGQTPAVARPIVLAAHGLKQGAPADIVLGKVDAIDQAAPEDYYKLLDCGLRLPLTAGADFPGRALGQARCYVNVPGTMTYAKWIQGITRGRVFATSGPLLLLEVNDKTIGEEIRAAPTDLLDIRLVAHSRRPLGHIQVVSNGALLHDGFSGSTTEAIQLTISASRSRWIVARCTAAPQMTFDPIREPDAAHTSAIYVVVDGQPVFVDSGAAEELEQQCQAGGDFVYSAGSFYGAGAQSKRSAARNHFYAGRDAYRAILTANAP